MKLFKYIIPYICIVSGFFIPMCFYLLYQFAMMSSISGCSSADPKCSDANCWLSWNLGPPSFQLFFTCSCGLYLLTPFLFPIFRSNFEKPHFETKSQKFHLNECKDKHSGISATKYLSTLLQKVWVFQHFLWFPALPLFHFFSEYFSGFILNSWIVQTLQNSIFQQISYSSKKPNPWI